MFRVGLSAFPTNLLFIEVVKRECANVPSFLLKTLNLFSSAKLCIYAILSKYFGGKVMFLNYILHKSIAFKHNFTLYCSLCAIFLC